MEISCSRARGPSPTMRTYQVGPGAGYFATIVYVGDDRSRASLTAVGNSVR